MRGRVCILNTLKLQDSTRDEVFPNCFSCLLNNLVSDGATNFHVAWKKEYAQAPQTKHIRHVHLQGDRNNNKMERMNGEIRDREKVMRGLKKMDTPILTGCQIYHNYFREHEGLEGKTPAEAANIRIEGQNKWITVIQNAKLKAN